MFLLEYTDFNKKYFQGRCSVLFISRRMEEHINWIPPPQPVLLPFFFLVYKLYCKQNEYGHFGASQCWLITRIGRSESLSKKIFTCSSNYCKWSFKFKICSHEGFKAITVSRQFETNTACFKNGNLCVSPYWVGRRFTIASINYMIPSVTLRPSEVWFDYNLIKKCDAKWSQLGNGTPFL